MTPRSRFWVPVVLAPVLLWVVALALWHVFGALVGLLAGLASATAWLGVHLYCLSRLRVWLSEPERTRPSSAWGAWAEVYARLYHIQQNESRSRSELADGLARFKQTVSLLPDGVVMIGGGLSLEWC
ncbi:MAG: phosphate regulon sensor protein PhoR, partial [Burkholderiaceae bacterium]|nr:phosphate regulon sensor protein PhoR [Burkholderiaceae bacterium]